MANLGKPSTATKEEIQRSGLSVVKGAQVASLVEEGKVRENTAERCLVCLEDWKVRFSVFGRRVRECSDEM